MSDKLYGQCAICGGSLTADHKCWPIPPPTDKEGANESLRIALQNIQDAATKPLHVEIESLRSRLAEAEYQWKYWMGVADDNGIKSIKARLAEANALLRNIYSYAEDQGMETLMDMIDAAMEQSHE
jgi:hypothetical protein